jgi:hypothetical protein
MEFDVMDSTFLQAVLECGDKGVTILDMIAIIDYVDRSTPTFEMFIDALGRLSEAGLIKEKDGKYYPTSHTDDVMETIKKTNRRRRQVNILSEFLDTWQVESTIRAKKCKMPSKKEYDDALDDYLPRKRRSK